MGSRTTLTEIVARAIADAPCSLRALAREAGVPHSTLIRIVNGERDATPAVARAVAEALRRWSDQCAASAAGIERRLRQVKRRNRKTRGRK